MTTLIKTKFNISDDQMNIDKYRLAANITENHIKINLTTNHYYKLLWSRELFEVNFNTDLESPSNFQVKEEINYSNRSINKKFDFCGPVSHLRESTISDLESP